MHRFGEQVHVNGERRSYRCQDGGGDMFCLYGRPGDNDRRLDSIGLASDRLREVLRRLGGGVNEDFLSLRSKRSMRFRLRFKPRSFESCRSRLVFLLRDELRRSRLRGTAYLLEWGERDR